MGRAEVHNDESNFKAYKKIQMRWFVFVQCAFYFALAFHKSQSFNLFFFFRWTKWTVTSITLFFVVARP